MILAPLTGAALVLSVATGPNVAPTGSTQLSVQQKNVAIQQFVRTARRAGIPVQAWIVDDEDEMRRLVAWGVTGLISDRPDRALQVSRSDGSNTSA